MAFPNKTCDVAVVGEIYVDHVFSGFKVWPKPGEEVLTDDYAREVGGGAAITACGLARLGRRVKLIGQVGLDNAEWIGVRLAGLGVGNEGLRVIEDGATGVTVSVSTQRDRSFFTHIGVNRTLSALLGGEAAIGELESARHVHFAMPLERAVAETLLPRLRAAGCTTSLDVGYQPVWLNDDVNTQTLQQIDYFLPNQKEAELWCGVRDEDAFFSRARAFKLAWPMIKLGARGAVAERGGVRRRVHPPRVDVVDTTGAGDAFDAGFIDALLDDASVEDCLRRACFIGALSTRAAGALSALPDREDLRSLHESLSYP